MRKLKKKHFKQLNEAISVIKEHNRVASKIQYDYHKKLDEINKLDDRLLEMYEDKKRLNKSTKKMFDELQTSIDKITSLMSAYLKEQNIPHNIAYIYKFIDDYLNK